MHCDKEPDNGINIKFGADRKEYRLVKQPNGTAKNKRGQFFVCVCVVHPFWSFRANAVFDNKASRCLRRRRVSVNTR